METSSVVKVIAAFFTGVILVMGGGLIYSRTRDLIYPVAVARTVPHAEQASLLDRQASAENENRPPNQTPKASQVSRPNANQPSTIRDGRETASPKILGQETSDAFNFSQPAASGPKTYQITDPYPVPILVPPASTVKQSTEPPSVRQISLDAEPAAAPRQPVHSVTLQPGTNLNVTLSETLSTDRHLKSSTFKGTLDSPIVANGLTIAERGSVVIGRIVNLHRAHLLGSAAKFTLQLMGINTSDGQLLRINTFPLEMRGTSLNSRTGSKMVFGFNGGSRESGKVEKNSKTVVLPLDAHLTFSLSKPVTIRRPRELPLG